MGYKVLVVDDELDLRVLLTIFLKRAGCEVEVAANGREAFQKILNSRPDLVISDIRMPQGDGFELMEKISHLPDPCLPVLFISGYADGNEIRLKSYRNFAGFLSKPISGELLSQKVLDLQHQFQSDGAHNP